MNNSFMTTQEISLGENEFSLPMSITSLSIDPLGKKQSKFKEYQAFLLRLFLSQDHTQDNQIIKYMDKIFKLKDPLKGKEDNIENDSIYYIHNNNTTKKKNKFTTSHKSSTLTANRNRKDKIDNKENDLFIDLRDNSTNNISKGNSDVEKVKFITKKRSNYEKINNNQNPNIKIVNFHTKKSESKNHDELQYRLDAYKKAIKVNSFQYLTKLLNYLLDNSEYRNRLKSEKILKQNSSFTKNVKDEDNLKFITMKIKEIYCYVKDETKSEGINKQKQNKRFITKLMKYMDENKNSLSENMKTIETYLNMTMEEYIEIYYGTEDFKKFCKKKKIKFFEKEFIKEKGFPMLKELGFLRLIKMNQKQ